MNDHATLTICGTNTGVGKSWVAAGLLQALAPLRVAPFKPLESGVEDAPDGLPRDARALLSASGLDLPLDEVCPWQLPRPVAPAMELQRLDIRCEASDIQQAHRALLERAATTRSLVEPAGGVLSPLTATLDSCDVARLLAASVLLVARDELGCVSQIRCAYEALQHRGIKVVGIVLNAGAPPAPGSAHEPTPTHNPELISRYVECGVFPVRESLSSELIAHVAAFYGADAAG